MGCFLSTEKKNQLNTDLIKVNSQLALLNAAYDDSITNSEVEEYSFNSSEGNQRTLRRKPKEIMEQITLLESKRDRIIKQLTGSGLVNIGLRRRG